VHVFGFCHFLLCARETQKQKLLQRTTICPLLIKMNGAGLWALFSPTRARDKLQVQRRTISCYTVNQGKSAKSKKILENTVHDYQAITRG
jgi:hypothetical protein